MAKSVDSPYIFTWSGTLNTGEMKISCDKQSDWNGDWLVADKSGKAPTGEVETALFTSKNGCGTEEYVSGYRPRQSGQ